MKSRISWSKINLYRQCPFKYKKVNIEKIYEPETVFLWRGKVLHACIEKLANQFLMQNIENLNTFLTQFEYHFMRKEFQHTLQNRMNIEGVDILTQFYFLVTECNLFQNLQKTEWYFKIPFTKSENVTLTGIIDRLDLKDNTYSLIDYKDGREHSFSDYSDQLKLYQWATIEKYGKEIDTVNIHLLKSQKILKRKAFSSKEIDILIDQICDIIKDIKEEKFEPKENQWCKYCTFKDECGI